MIDAICFLHIAGKKILNDIHMFSQGIIKAFLAFQGIAAEPLYHGIDPFVGADNQIVSA